MEDEVLNDLIRVADLLAIEALLDLSLATLGRRVRIGAGLKMRAITDPVAVLTDENCWRGFGVIYLSPLSLFPKGGGCLCETAQKLTTTTISSFVVSMMMELPNATVLGIVDPTASLPAVLGHIVDHDEV